jgi:hypothetical protein
MKRLAGLSALALIISSTSGCGWLWGEEGYFRDRGSDYLQAQQTAPMQLPPDVSNVKRWIRCCRSRATWPTTRQGRVRSAASATAVGHCRCQRLQPAEER